MSADARGGRAASLTLAVYGLIVAAITASYFLKYPVPEFLGKALALLSAFWLAYALHAAGSAIVWAAGWIWPTNWIRSLGPWNARLFLGGLGFAAVSFSIIILGWAVPGSLAVDLRIVLAGLILLTLAAAVLRPKTLPVRPRFAPVILLLVPGAGVMASLLSCFSPITYYDSLVYHLALPATYLQTGAIGYVPNNLYSAFPGACEAMYTFILGVLPSPEYVVNVFGWLIALGLGAAVAEWAVQVSGKKAGWIAVALWWSMPPVLLLCQGAYVDLPLAAATYLAVRAGMAWILDAEAGPGSLSAGLFCGLAISIKYTGAITAVLLFGVLTALALRRRTTTRTLIGFAAAAIVIPAPWLIKNAVTLGNPFFPFLYKLFGGNVGWTGDTAAGYFQVLTEYSSRSNLLVDLLTPWKSASTRGGFDVLGDFGWPLLLLAALPAGLLSVRRDVRLVAAYFAIHFMAWYLSKPVFRFLIPVMPLAALLAAVTISDLTSHRGRIARHAAVLLTAAWITSNVFLYGLAADGLRLFTVPFGKLDSKTFLEQRFSFYPTFEYLNDHSAPGEKVLIIGEQRTYHLRVPYLSSNLFAPSPIAATCNAATSLNDITRFVLDNRVTRILVSEGEVERRGGYGKLGFTEAGAVAFRNFLAVRARVISNDRGVILYALAG